MQELPIVDFHTKNYPSVTFRVRYRVRKYEGSPIGGYTVHLENDRNVGWVVKDRDGKWAARVNAAAFRGDGPDDEGHILDEVPYELDRCGSGSQVRPVAIEDTREWAAEQLLQYLHNEGAPALGFSRHPAVRRWEGRRRHRPSSRGEPR